MSPVVGAWAPICGLCPGSTHAAIGEPRVPPGPARRRRRPAIPSYETHS
jgi:hypothetical protein